VNPQGGNTETIKGNKQASIYAIKEVGVEENIEKSYVYVGALSPKLGRNREIKLARKSFENASQFKYLATAVTNQNLVQEEI
jgi:fumarate hydratase class II